MTVEVVFNGKGFSTTKHLEQVYGRTFVDSKSNTYQVDLQK